MARRNRKSGKRQTGKGKPENAPGGRNTGHLAVRTGLTAVLGVLLFLSQPYYSLSFRILPPLGPFLPVILLPAIVGAFAGLSVPGLVRGVVLGFLIPGAGTAILWFFEPGGFPWPAPGGVALIQGVIAGAGALAMGYLKRWIPVTRLSFLVLALILLNFALLVDHGKDRVYSGSAIEPPMESYNFDGVFYLKVFYLLEQGRDFYSAWDTAFRGDARYAAPFPLVWSWRMPTSYWMWSALASRGDTLLLYFVLLSLAGMVAAYIGASKHSDASLGLWSAGFLGSYLHFGAITFWYTMTDYWSVFFAIPAVALYLHGRRNLALPLAFLAGLTREWTALLLVAGFLDNLLGRRWRESGAWALGCVLVAGAYLAHWSHVAEYLRQVGVPAAIAPDGGVGRRGGILFLLYTVSYASRFFPGGPVLLYVVFASGLLGAATAWVRCRDAFPSLAILVVFGGLMLYGHGMRPGDPPGTGDYYSINFMPYAIMFVPVVLRLVEKATTPGESGSRSSPGPSAV